MDRKLLFTALAAAVFALPLAAGANTGKSASTSASANTANDGGAEAMFKSLDKNGDGFLSKDEVAGTPHAADFASLDKNGDGKLSRDEHYNAKEHVAARSKGDKTASASNGSSADTSKKTY